MTRIVVHASVLLIFTFLFLTSAPSPALAQPLEARPCPLDATPVSPEPIGNIRVDEVLEPLVSALLAKSETFRRQWDVISASRFIRVTVVLRLAMQDPGSARARAEVSRYAHGAIRATIEVPSATDLTELLPHEFEHVIEQLEGLDLRALARRREGAWPRSEQGSSKPRGRGRRACRSIGRCTARPIPPSRRRSAASGGPGARWGCGRGRKLPQKPPDRSRIGARGARSGAGRTFISVGNRIRWIIVFAYSSRVDHTPSVPVRLNDRLVTLRIPLGVVRRAICG